MERYQITFDGRVIEKRVPVHMVHGRLPMGARVTKMGPNADDPLDGATFETLPPPAGSGRVGTIKRVK